MPCCALAACIIGQFILAYHAMKRMVLGESADDTRNATVEWRLGDELAPSVAADTRPIWLRSRRALGGLAIAAAIELLLVFGGMYAVFSHFGHGADHAAHVHAAK